MTLVFTDIAGSTKLLEERPDAYPALLAAHRRLVREVVGRRSGAEVDTQGDAFFLAFRRPSDAVAAAQELVSALAAAGPIRLRVGIHTGEPALTEEGYVGMDVHRAARIAAAGHAGQVLLSEATRRLVTVEPLRDLGVHRLKDVGELRLYQLGDGEFPPIRSLRRGNVGDGARTPIGRDRELRELTSILVDDRARLVTLTGPGGIGKTTLALALAGALDRYVDGRWFVDLSSVQDPALVESHVAVTIGAPGDVETFLAATQVLLVLDNLEQVPDVAPTIGRWLRACPELTVIATSRVALQLQDERRYPVVPLDDKPAIELFRRRAQAVDPAFDASDALLGRICRRLDSLPLAIELAAARVSLLTPERLLERLGERLPLLTGGARDLPARQQTLERTIAWSHDLLDDAERAAFARLGVFVGGWTLDAAEAVAGTSLDTLQSLIDRSLVRRDGERFGMLETIREFAAARLAERDDAADVRRRHLRWFADLAVAAGPELTAGDQEGWLAVLDAEAEDLRAALDRAAADRDAQSRRHALRLAGGLTFFWYMRGRSPEGAARLRQTLAMTPEDDTPERLAALWGAGFHATIEGDPDAELLATAALGLARRVEDPSMIARSLDVLGLLAFFQNDLAGARRMYEEAIGSARTAGDDWCTADALGTIGSIYPLVGEYEAGREAGREAFAHARRRNDLQGMRMALFALALTARRMGDHDAARVEGDEGLAISRRLGDPFFASYFLWVLASVAHASGDADRAATEAAEALRIAREVGATLLIVCGLEAVAAVARAAGDTAAASDALHEAVALTRQAPVPGSYVAEVLRALGELEAESGDRTAGRARLDASLQLAREVGDPWAERRARVTIERLAGAEPH